MLAAPRVPVAPADSATRRAQAGALKEEGNALAKAGKKADACIKYEEGMCTLGVPPFGGMLELPDEQRAAALQALDGATRELLSTLASNAAQMYLDPDATQFGDGLNLAVEMCSAALEANPSNAKAYFRRASALYERADGGGKMANEMLALAQIDIQKFLQTDPQNSAARQLQQRIRESMDPVHNSISASPLHAAPAPSAPAA